MRLHETNKMISINLVKKKMEETNFSHLGEEFAYTWAESQKKSLLSRKQAFAEVYQMAQKALSINGEKVKIKPFFNKETQMYSFSYFCTLGNRWYTLGHPSKLSKVMLETVKEELKREYSYYL